jgi:hypothetical protein
MTFVFLSESSQRKSLLANLIISRVFASAIYIPSVSFVADLTW